jgi:hypothetical protein
MSENWLLPRDLPIRLICWNPDLASEHAAVLKEAGFTVDASPSSASRLVGQFRENPPAAIVIDLDRLPSHGMAVGVMLRRSKTTAPIPLVFAGGAEEKVARARQQLPDAVFAPWKSAAAAIRKTIKRPSRLTVRPPSPMNSYKGSSLVRKLDLKPGVICALIGAPEGFDERLDGLPETVGFQRRITPQSRLAIWFVRSRAEMEAALDLASLRLPGGASIWIAYPKRSGRHRADFNLNDVRAAALAAGMVDYKICAVDEDWSALKFARKRTTE